MHLAEIYVVSKLPYSYIPTCQGVRICGGLETSEEVIKQGVITVGDRKML